MFSKSFDYASEILFIRDFGFDDYSKHTVLTILPMPSYSQHSDKTYRFSMLPAFEMQGRVGCIADCIGHQLSPMLHRPYSISGHKKTPFEIL